MNTEKNKLCRNLIHHLYGKLDKYGIVRVICCQSLLEVDMKSFILLSSLDKYFKDFDFDMIHIYTANKACSIDVYSITDFDFLPSNVLVIRTTKGDYTFSGV